MQTRKAGTAGKEAQPIRLTIREDELSLLYDFIFIFSSSRNQGPELIHESSAKYVVLESLAVMVRVPNVDCALS